MEVHVIKDEGKEEGGRIFIVIFILAGFDSTSLDVAELSETRTHETRKVSKPALNSSSGKYEEEYW